MSTWFNQFINNKNTNTTLIDGYVQVADASGTLGVQGVAGGTLSFVSTGTYDLLLDQSYSLELYFDAVVHSQNSRTGLGCEVQWSNPGGTVDSFGHAAQTIRFSFLSSTTPTNLPANSGFTVAVVLKNSAAKVGS